MQVTETLSEGLKRGFTVVVPGEDIETRRAARLADLGKTLRLPGFRPGKVPLPIVRQRFGNAVTAEVLEESVNQATEQMLTERKMRPAQTPKIDLVSTDIGAGAAKDLEFKVEFELLPDIAMPDFSRLELIRRKAEVAPETIDQALADMAVRNRELVEITPEELAARSDNPGAATGEVLTVDFVGKIDGEPFPNGASNDVNIELGGTGFIPGFAEQLEGMKAGRQPHDRGHLPGGVQRTRIWPGRPPRSTSPPRSCRGPWCRRWTTNWRRNWRSTTWTGCGGPWASATSANTTRCPASG